MDLRANNGKLLGPEQDGQEILLTLFVGAIGSETTTESIASYFEGFGTVNKVKIIVDWVTKQSKDCALVYFTSQDSVRKVLDFPKHIIDGRVVRVEPADRTKKGTKLNEANALHVSCIHHLTPNREVIEYFAIFGQITSCKFFKERSMDGSLKGAIIRFEKYYSLERVLLLGSEHLVGGKIVFCSMGNQPLEGSLLLEEVHASQLQLLQQSSSLPVPPQINSMFDQTRLSPDGNENQRFVELNIQPSRNVDKPEDSRESINPTLQNDSLNPPKEICSNKPKTRINLLPLEYQNDDLFSIFCDFNKPLPSPKVRWEDTPYAHLGSKRRANK